MFGTRSQGKVYNFVHTDEIWKDHVIRELQSQKKWTEQWGYLFEEYQKLQEGLLNIGSELEDEVKLGLEVEQNLDGVLKLEECETGAILATSEAVMDCTVGTPLATNEAVMDCTVENVSGHIARLQENARGKNDILKLLKWPREGMM